MIPGIENIGRDKCVSSQDSREFNDRVRYELSSLYHRSLALTSELNAVSSMLSLTDAAAIDLIRKYINVALAASGDYIIDAKTERSDPSILSAIESGETSIEFGTLTSHRVSSESVFVDHAGKQKSNIIVTRTTLNGIVDEAPDSIVENNANHIFDTKVPYILNFKKQNLAKASINLDIKSDSTAIRMNALRFIPYPGAGSLIMDGFWKDSAVPVKFNGGNSYIKPSSRTRSGTNPDYDQYTLPAYIHTELINTGNLRLGFSSERYITGLGGICVGIGALIGELNVYSRKSFFGYTITLPEGKNTLKSIELVPDVYSQSVSGISLYIYDDINHFNNMNDNYRARCMGVMSDNINITANANRQIYILIELESSNNISPVLTGLRLRFV